MGLLVKGLLLAVAGYVGAGAFMTYFQRRFQYFPGGELRTPEQASVPEFRPAFIPTGDGLDLEGWYAPAADPSKLTVAYFHGNAGNVSVRAPPICGRCWMRGLGVFLTGYRGYGGNPGAPSEQGLYWTAGPPWIF